MARELGQYNESVERFKLVYMKCSEILNSTDITKILACTTYALSEE